MKDWIMLGKKQLNLMLLLCTSPHPPPSVSLAPARPASWLPPPLTRQQALLAPGHRFSVGTACAEFTGPSRGHSFAPLPPSGCDAAPSGDALLPWLQVTKEVYLIGCYYV